MTNDAESHPFRDNTAGVVAKRRKLLSDRRDELATMSHAIRGVYAKRLSWLSAALALCLGGSLLVFASQDVAISDAIANYMPGNAPAALSTLLLATWILAGFGFFLGRSIAEHRFSLAMSRAVLPTDDLHVDVARLAHEAPDAVGKRMARKLETVSRMSAILAAGVILPATLVTSYLLIKAGGYPEVDVLEHMLMAQSSALLCVALMAAGLAMLIALRPNWRPHTLFSLNLVASGIAAILIAPALLPLSLVSCSALGLISFLSASRHQKQNAKIEQEGAPLPPVFQLRPRVAGTLSALRSLPAALRGIELRKLLRGLGRKGRAALGFRPSAPQLMTVSLLACGLAAGVLALSSSSEAEAKAETIAHQVAPAPEIVERPGSSAQRVENLDGDGALIDFSFRPGAFVDASELLRGASIPAGWRAQVTITRESGDGLLFVQALPDGAYDAAPRQIGASNPSVIFSQSNCSGLEMPLELKASAYGSWPEEGGSARLRYSISLELMGSCNVDTF